MADTIVTRLMFDVRQANEGLKRTISNIDLVNAHINKAVQNARMQFAALQNLFMGMGLSILFTGMALKNFLQNALGAMISTFMTVSGEQSALSNQVDNLRAKWEFLKFSFIDAAKQTGLWDVWLDRLNKVLDWVDNLSAETKATIVNWMTWGVIIGGLMMLFGQFFLFLLGPLALINFLVEGALALFLKIGGILKWVGGIAATVGRFFLGFFLTPVGLAVLAIVALFGILIAKFGSVKLAFKAVGIFLLAVLAFIGDAIIQALLLPLRLVIGTINGLIRAKNALTGTSIAQIQQPEFGTLSKNVATMKAELIAEAETGFQRPEGNTININVEGNVDQNVFEQMKTQLEEMMAQNSGSTSR